MSHQYNRNDVNIHRIRSSRKKVIFLLLKCYHLQKKKHVSLSFSHKAKNIIAMNLQSVKNLKKCFLIIEDRKLSFTFSLTILFFVDYDFLFRRKLFFSYCGGRP